MALASRSRLVSSILTVAVLASSAACSVILNPRDDVQRCSNVDDCEVPEDERYEAVCISDESADIDTTVVDQVCVAQFKTIGCDATQIRGEFLDAVDSRTFSDYDCTDSLGARGCPPTEEGACAEGLSNVGGTCDDPNADVPAINLGPSFSELDAQDVKDQFCRGYFCDDSYVCNTETNACQECDPSAPFGQGGCGDVYTQGTPSCVYTDACDAPMSTTTMPIFGDCIEL